MPRLNCGRFPPLELTAREESFPLKQPFRIAGTTFEVVRVISVCLHTREAVGQGEACGVYYHSHQTPRDLLQQIDAVRTRIESGVDREILQTLLPGGGARNALDCALWDLQSKLEGTPAWQIASVPHPSGLTTTFTVGADTPEKMARDALGYHQAKAIKLKLTGDGLDAERVHAVVAERPDVWLGVDANQGLTPTSFAALLPALVEARVKLIEQPFPMHRDEWMDGIVSPIPLAADESAQTSADLARLVGRFDVINIKLDKCGGLTEGLRMARTAREMGFRVMVGNMMGSSLSMAPALLVGQLCDVVDLDGPALLSSDRPECIEYRNGLILSGSTDWGVPVAQRR